MKLTIESTPIITTINGALARLWVGATEDGQAVEVYTVAVGSDDPEVQRRLFAELVEIPVDSSPDLIAAMISGRPDLVFIDNHGAPRNRPDHRPGPVGDAS